MRSAAVFASTLSRYARVGRGGTMHAVYSPPNNSLGLADGRTHLSPSRYFVLPIVVVREIQCQRVDSTIRRNM